MHNVNSWQDNLQRRVWRRNASICWFVLGILVVSISGCSRPDANHLFDDYQQRLDRVLKLTPAELQLAELPAIPPIRELQQSIAASQLNLLDLVALRHCNLQHLVAERNNSLGKVMTSANMLGYELQLLGAIKPCLKHPALTEKLQSELLQIYQQKTQQLPLVLENFLISDNTLRKQLSGHQRLLAKGASHAVTEPLMALKNLNLLKEHVQRGQEQQYSTYTADFINQQLGVLYQGHFIADWQYSLRRSNAWLTMLNQQLAEVPLDNLCRQPAKIEILNNILTQIFASRIQQYLAELDGLSYQLLPQLELLYQDTALADSVEQRMAEPARQLRMLLQQHVRWYQQLQQQCKLKLPTVGA